MSKSRIVPILLIIFFTVIQDCSGGLELLQGLVGVGSMRTDNIGVGSYSHPESVLFVGRDQEQYGYAQHFPPPFHHPSSFDYYPNNYQHHLKQLSHYFNRVGSAGMDKASRDQNQASLIQIGSNPKSKQDQMHFAPQIIQAYHSEESPGFKGDRRGDSSSSRSLQEDKFEETRIITTPTTTTVPTLMQHPEHKQSASLTTPPSSTDPTSSGKKDVPYSRKVGNTATPKDAAMKQYGYPSPRKQYRRTPVAAKTELGDELKYGVYQ